MEHGISRKKMNSNSYKGRKLIRKRRKQRKMVVKPVQEKKEYLLKKIRKLRKRKMLIMELRIKKLKK